MASISAPGIGSGLDVSGIVSSLMAVERRPLTLLQNAVSLPAFKTRLTAYSAPLLWLQPKRQVAMKRR
jgi:flagellar hook-associated protein 2